MKTWCPVCGGSEYKQNDVLWPELVQEWGLNETERHIINRQQGHTCTGCGCNMRCRALAFALMEVLTAHPRTADLVKRSAFSGPLHHVRTAVPSLKVFTEAVDLGLNILEINECGALHEVLKRSLSVQFHQYPDIDMQEMSRTAMESQVDLRARFTPGHFDLIVHSDTLEHVPNPVGALEECHALLRKGGAVVFTVPMLPHRLTRTRKGPPDSFHGGPHRPADNLVHTEYGGDAWAHLALAGFRDIRTFIYEYPSGVALCGVA